MKKNWKHSKTKHENWRIANKQKAKRTAQRSQPVGSENCLSSKICRVYMAYSCKRILFYVYVGNVAVFHMYAICDRLKSKFSIGFVWRLLLLLLLYFFPFSILIRNNMLCIWNKIYPVCFMLYINDVCWCELMWECHELFVGVCVKICTAYCKNLSVCIYLSECT